MFYHKTCDQNPDRKSRSVIDWAFSRLLFTGPSNTSEKGRYIYVFTNTEDKVLNKIIVHLQVGRINSIVMKRKNMED